MTIPWTEFEKCETPPGFDVRDPLNSDLTVWLNSRYEVQKRELDAGMTYLSIKRLKKEAVHDWRELQRVKNDLCGENREGMELYPSMLRVVDTTNQYHLFVLPLGTGFNIGWCHGPEVNDEAPDRYEWGKGRQRPLPGWMKGATPRPLDQAGEFAMGANVDGELQLITKVRTA